MIDIINTTIPLWSDFILDLIHAIFVSRICHRIGVTVLCVSGSKSNNPDVVSEEVNNKHYSIELLCTYKTFTVTGSTVH